MSTRIPAPSALPRSGVGVDALLDAATIARRLRPEVPLAIATLVDVDGSSFRQPGARLLVDAESRCLAGAISGGCLEADVAARAADVCASGMPVSLVYDLRDDLQTIWGFDAACDGVATILLEPLHDLHWLEDAVHARTARAGGALLTVVRCTASTNAAITPGTVGVVHAGGTARIAIHSDALQHAVGSLLHTVAETRRATLLDCTIDDADVRLFAEPLLSPVALHVIGAGRGAEAFARIASAMGWQVTIVDHRPALLESLVLPQGVTCRVARPEQAHELVADDASAVALMTHIFEIDRAWLDALCRRDHAYIGVLGSRQRAQRLLDAVSPAPRAALHAPIGLDIGGESPESIALATVAEIHAVMHARPGGSLRERRSPIHDRTPVPVQSDTTRGSLTDITCRLPA